MGSADHRHFEESKLCLQSGQLSHWCKHMGSIWVGALELHGYWFWQFAWLGCSMRCVPNCAQIQVARNPLYLAHDFPSPALPTGLSAEHVHVAWCVCQMAWAAPSSQYILVISGTWPKVARWRSTALEHLQDSSQIFGRGTINDINLLNEFCRGSFSCPHWLFLQEVGFGLGLLNMRWMSRHKASHKSTVLPQWWFCGQVPRNN